MTTPTLYEAAPISFSVHKPVYRGRRHLFDLTEWIAWRQVDAALGGWWEAQLVLEGKESVLQDWIEDGLDRDIEAHAPEGLIWNGFVNAATLVTGRETISRGPLLDVCNRCNLVYSGIDTSIVPPAVGMRIPTGWADFVASQTLYGKLERVLTTGGLTPTNAAQERDRFLRAMAYPAKTTSDGRSATGACQLTLDLCGHIRKTERYTYNSTTTGDQSLSTKLLAVLAAEPNGLFSTDYSQIAANTLWVPAYENDLPTAWEVFKDLVTQGDSSYQRYVFGCHEDRRLSYQAASEDIAYLQDLSDPRGLVRTPQEQIVRPYLLRAGQFLFRPDAALGEPVGGQEDPRRKFLETVTFTAPGEWTFTSGTTDQAKQMLEQWGLSGIGV